MPDGRKALLILGLVALVAARVILRKKKVAHYDTITEKGTAISV